MRLACIDAPRRYSLTSRPCAAEGSALPPRSGRLVARRQEEGPGDRAVLIRPFAAHKEIIPTESLININFDYDVPNVVRYNDQLQPGDSQDRRLPRTANTDRMDPKGCPVTDEDVRILATDLIGSPRDVGVLHRTAKPFGAVLASNCLRPSSTLQQS